ncbi:MAG: 23S rRNA (pseudouridine(1915)-N(3))-methyltransferase RlmH [Patescibacteria group bacterium]
MMYLEIVTVGRQKRGPLLELAQEYQKRLGGLVTLKTTVVKKIKPSAEFTILLTEHGKTYNSTTFAQQLLQWTDCGRTHIRFVVAGPHGHDRTIEKQMNALLSLSPMTFPHEFAYVILLEQLYRAITIIKEKIYHY